jgi:hypothetical protein
MADIFVSHVEEDQELAETLSGVLQETEYSTWLYERDALPGVSYLVQTGEAIHECKAFLLLVTPFSLGSNQVTVEIIRAFEEGKPIFGLRNGVSHSDLQRRQPEWRQAIGSSATVPVDRANVREAAARILGGLQRLSITPSRQCDTTPKARAVPASNREKAEIMVSAHSALRNVTEELAESLRRLGFTVCSPFDFPATSSNSADALDARLEDAQTLLVLGEKPDDFKRSWVEYEYRAFHLLQTSGRKTNGRLCSVIVGTKMTPAELPLPLSLYHAVQYNPDTPAESLRELVSRLGLAQK